MTAEGKRQRSHTILPRAFDRQSRAFLSKIAGELNEQDGLTELPQERMEWVPVLNIHALRHTFNSVSAATGEAVEALSAHLGHRKASVTRDIYRHVFEGERRGLAYDPPTGSKDEPE